MLKNNFRDNKIVFLKQGNYCVSFLRKTKRDYHGNSNKSEILRKLLSLFFTYVCQVILVEGNTIFRQNAKNSEIMNTFLSNVEKNLNITESEEVKLSAGTKSHPILKAIFKYSKHPSIIVTKNTAKNKGQHFNFHVLVLMMYLRKPKKLKMHRNSEECYFCKYSKTKYRFFFKLPL